MCAQIAGHRSEEADLGGYGAAEGVGVQVSARGERVHERGRPTWRSVRVRACSSGHEKAAVQSM